MATTAKAQGAGVPRNFLGVRAFDDSGPKTIAEASAFNRCPLAHCLFCSRSERCGGRETIAYASRCRLRSGRNRLLARCETTTGNRRRQNSSTKSHFRFAPGTSGGSGRVPCANVAGVDARARPGRLIPRAQPRNARGGCGRQTTCRRPIGSHLRDSRHPSFASLAKHRGEKSETDRARTYAQSGFSDHKFACVSAGLFRARTISGSTTSNSRDRKQAASVTIRQRGSAGSGTCTRASMAYRVVRNDPMLPQPQNSS